MTNDACRRLAVYLEMRAEKLSVDEIREKKVINKHKHLANPDGEVKKNKYSVSRTLQCKTSSFRFEKNAHSI